MDDVLVSLIPGFQPLDVVGPHEVLALATALTDEKGQVPLEDYPASSTIGSTMALIELGTNRIHGRTDAIRQ